MNSLLANQIHKQKNVNKKRNSIQFIHPIKPFYQQPCYCHPLQRGLGCKCCVTSNLTIERTKPDKPS